VEDMIPDIESCLSLPIKKPLSFCKQMWT